MGRLNCLPLPSTPARLCPVHKVLMGYSLQDGYWCHICCRPAPIGGYDEDGTPND